MRLVQRTDDCIILLQTVTDSIIIKDYQDQVAEAAKEGQAERKLLDIFAQGE